MPLAPFHCALGDSPEVELPAGATVAIAPGDDSVDSNRVRIVGTGTISSFGVACDGVQGELGEPATVTKRIAFVPTAPGVTLHHNPPELTLLGGVDRVITKNAFGTYASDVDGNWTETEFSQSDIKPIQGHAPTVSIIYYTASATITIPAGATRAWVRMWGGAGGSGAGDNTSAGSGGTGAPGYLEKFLASLTPGHTLVYTQGAAGTAGAGAGGNGDNSTLVSGTQTISTLTANGSLGSGSAAGGVSTAGTAGGTATGGDFNITGQSGTPCFINPTQVGIGGSTAITRGTNGSFGATGVVGRSGGLIIAWFNDAIG